MFCPNCGKAEQTLDTYCRSCGEFLADLSDRFSLINRILGVNTPEKQISVNLIINLVTSVVSSLLLVFLNGYFDAHYTRIHEPTPPIIYFVYLFLGLVAAWQFLSFVINLRLKSKFGSRKVGKVSASSSMNENTLSSGTAQKSLPQASFENIAPTSVTEDTTKILDKLTRK